MHETLGHIGFTTLQLMASYGIVSKDLSTIPPHVLDAHMEMIIVANLDIKTFRTKCRFGKECLLALS